MKNQWVKGMFRPLSGCTGTRESTGRWVMGPALSNNLGSGDRHNGLIPDACEQDFNNLNEK
jgi:hypothetical protein